MPATDLLACLDYILKDNTPAAEFPLGVLTSENRDTWAKVRTELEGQGNSESLNLLDSSIFNLALDDLEMNDNRDLMLRSYLHGDGTNRYFHFRIVLYYR